MWWNLNEVCWIYESESWFLIWAGVQCCAEVSRRKRSSRLSPAENGRCSFQFIRVWRLQLHKNKVTVCCCPQWLDRWRGLVLEAMINFALEEMKGIQLCSICGNSCSTGTMCRFHSWLNIACGWWSLFRSFTSVFQELHKHAVNLWNSVYIWPAHCFYND